MTFHAVYENGVFKPLDEVDLPEKTRVLVVEEQNRKLPEVSDADVTAIYEVLSRRIVDPSSPGNRAERHNEHQP